MTFKEAIFIEVDTLPEAKQADVLAFSRFVKIGLAGPEMLDKRFGDALVRARAIAAERQITEQDIEAEIKAARATR
ncbi:MAG: hypothetical protein HZB77_04515 [Chloroflexi bacterium]|nr:hypothetical protein [Chloroflexota bacterium]